MLKVYVDELIPISVSLVDELSNSLSSGQTVYYDVREAGDTVLTPPINGVMSESTLNSGIYYTTFSLSSVGNYICYITCAEFLSNAETIIVETEPTCASQNNNHYNNSIEDIKRVNVTPTASQIARNVPLGYTDYVITRIKNENDTDWSNPVSSGTVFAHYHAITDAAPYKMGGPT